MDCNEVKRGLKVRTNSKLESTTGMMVSQSDLEKRRPNTVGHVQHVVGGHGGDVWWVGHEDGEVVPYCFTEFERFEDTELKKNPQPAQLFPDEPDIYTIAGPSGCGKTTLALSDAWGSAMRGSPVLYLTTQMSEDQVMAHIDKMAGADFDCCPVFEADIGLGMMRVAGTDFYFCCGGLTPGKADLATERVDKSSFVYIDSFNQILWDPVHQTARMDRGMCGLRRLVGAGAKVVVVADASRRDHYPQTDDICGTSMIERVSSVVKMLVLAEIDAPGFSDIQVFTRKNRYEERNWTNEFDGDMQLIVDWDTGIVFDRNKNNYWYQEEYEKRQQDLCSRPTLEDVQVEG